MIPVLPVDLYEAKAAQKPSLLLRVLVGSRAHGLADEGSDWDYRTVYVRPTREILSLERGGKERTWHEGDGTDETGWEVGHFLNLARHCNPTILEVFAAPVVYPSSVVMMAALEGTPRKMLLALLPALWSPDRVRDAFIGYGLNQRKKFLDDKDQRGPKYACAYLRVLYQAYILLTTGVMPVNMGGVPVYETLLRWRRGEYTKGEVIDTTERWRAKVEDAAGQCRHTPDYAKANEVLLSLRRAYW